MRKRRDSVAHHPRSIPAGDPPDQDQTYLEALLGIDPDDPATREIARAAMQLRMLYDLDVRESPELLAKAVERGRRAYRAQQDRWSTPSETAPSTPVVYYMRIGQLVKIGTSKQLTMRLRAYPPTAVLLATEPGSYDVERQRHREFAETAVKKQSEYFYPSAALIGHINSLREQPLTAADLTS